MTRLKINPGACGLPTVVEVDKIGENRFSVSVSSPCEMARRLGEAIAELTLRDAFKRMLDNPVYLKASSILQHVSCPEPAAILKALEVEAGLAVPKDVLLEFVDGGEAG